MKTINFEAVIVGAGFGGIYQLKKLRDLGMYCLLIDAAEGVGGVWYWNQHPGAMSDTESFVYRYSWDKEDLQQYPWKERYLAQHEVLAYLNHVVDRHDIRKYMRFNTEVVSAKWDDDQALWTIQTKLGETITTRYLVTALGLLSKQYIPNIPGLNSFQGEMYHTGNWREKHSFAGKRVAVIGCGSTAVLVITALGQEAVVKQLLCFQRNPQYSVPSGNAPISQRCRKKINAHYEEIWHQVGDSCTGFGFKESTTPAMSVSAEEREKIFWESWRKGNGFRFMFGTFGDIIYNEEANKAACAFIRNRITETVKDSEKSRKLTPHGLYARRPLCDSGYYEVFNQDFVNVVDLKETPITAVTHNGIRTSNGVLHSLDVIILATGFDAVEGSYNRLSIKGSNEYLKDHWSQGPTSYLGMTVANFPNFFMITGPNSPFTNMPPVIESQVEWISDAIASGNKTALIEALPEAEEHWTKLCKELAALNLFSRTDSWIFGSNVPGKKRAVRFFFGGLRAYRQHLRECTDSSYKGFKPFLTRGIYPAKL